MTTLYRISDDRTKFCRKAMKANADVWNPFTGSGWRSRQRDVRTVPRDAAECCAA